MFDHLVLGSKTIQKRKTNKERERERKREREIEENKQTKIREWN